MDNVAITTDANFIAIELTQNQIHVTCLVWGNVLNLARTGNHDELTDNGQVWAH
jgi:hypothetical protein